MQSPSKGRRGRPAAEPDAAQLQLAGVLHIMKLLGSCQGGGAGQPAKKPLHPDIVYHIVDGLIDRCTAQRLLPAFGLLPCPSDPPFRDCLGGCNAAQQCARTSR